MRNKGQIENIGGPIVNIIDACENSMRHLQLIADDIYSDDDVNQEVMSTVRDLTETIYSQIKEYTKIANYLKWG